MPRIISGNVKMLQQKPDDFVICTGKQYSIRDFINMVSKALR